MNPYWEKDKSLTSRNHVLPKGEVTADSIRRRQGILESTPRIYDGYEDMDACRKPNARVQSYPNIIKEMIHGRENGRLHGVRSSSARAISGRPPLQPHSRRRMSGGPSSVSPRESHKYPGLGEAPQRGSSSSAFESLQQKDYKWNSGSGALTDRPPSQSFICHKISGKEYHKQPSLEEPRSESSIRLQQSDDSRWSSGSRATFDMAPFKALSESSIRSLKQSDDSSWSSGYRSA